jgi:outer membrane protein OmpA-like peptidoglycan-associated protein
MILPPFRKIIPCRGNLALIALSAFAVALCCSCQAQAQQKITSSLTKSLPKYNGIHGLVSDMLIIHTENGPIESFFGDLNFDYDSAAISATSTAKLMASAHTFSDPQLIRVEIVGHTDATGSEIYNRNLAQRRADAVKQILIEKFEVPEAKIMVEADGASGLLNEANPFAGENRRVHLVVTISAQ